MIPDWVKQKASSTLWQSQDGLKRLVNGLSTDHMFNIAVMYYEHMKIVYSLDIESVQTNPEIFDHQLTRWMTYPIIQAQDLMMFLYLLTERELNERQVYAVQIMLTQLRNEHTFTAVALLEKLKTGN